MFTAVRGAVYTGYVFTHERWQSWLPGSFLADVFSTCFESDRAFEIVSKGACPSLHTSYPQTFYFECCAFVSSPIWKRDVFGPSLAIYLFNPPLLPA